MHLSKLLSRANIGMTTASGAAAITGFVMFYSLTNRTVVHAEGVTTPFTFEVEVYSYRDIPTGDLLNRKVIARRSDGSTAIVATVGPVEWGRTARKLNFIDGREVSVFGDINAKTTLREPAPAIALRNEVMFHPAADCIYPSQNYRLLRKEVVFGQQTSVIQDEHDRGRDTRWVAAHMGCESLQWRYESKQSDGSWKLDSEGKPINLTTGEPDPTLFSVGSTLVETKPSEARRKYDELVGIPSTPELRLKMERADRQYERSQEEFAKEP